MKRARYSPRRVAVAAVLLSLVAADGRAAPPDHPIITEVFNNPLGNNDGPVGRELPASLLRRHADAVFWLDREAATGVEAP